MGRRNANKKDRSKGIKKENDRIKKESGNERENGDGGRIFSGFT